MNNNQDYVQVFNNRGFQLAINGVILSVQFGYGTYTENRDNDEMANLMSMNLNVKSHNCEIAIFPLSSATGEGPMKWLTREIWLELYGLDPADDVVGYLPPSKLAELICFLSQKQWKKGVIA